MPTFVYSALKSDGSIAKGEMSAADRAEAIRRLDRSGLQPVSLKTKDDNAPAASPKKESKPDAKSESKAEAKGKDAKAEGKSETKPAKKPRETPLSSGPVKLNTKQIVHFTEEISDLLSAGIQLEPALKIMESRDEASSLKTVATSLRQRVRDGSSFSGALRATSNSFGELFCSLAAAGEISGALGVILKRQSEYLKSLSQLQGRVITALIYPAFLFTAGMAVSFVFVNFLLPQLTMLLKQSGKELPGIAKAMMIATNFIKEWWWAILFVILLSVWLFQKITTHPKYREPWDRQKLQLPIFGKLFSGRFFVQFLETLANLCENGLPLLRSLELTRDATVNLYLRGLMDKTISMVAEGGSLSKSLKRVGFFPSLLTDMINVGEQTGDLPLALRRTAERYDKELNKTIERIQALIPIMVTVMMAIIVGSVAITMVNVIMESVSSISGKR